MQSAKQPASGGLLPLKPQSKPALVVSGAATLESLLHLEASGRNSLQQAEERERYTNCYDQIYPLVRNKELDFHRVAEESDLVERRVRECLLYRLSSGKVMQLFGLIPGRCYVCRKTLSTGCKEPICLNCLESIDDAVKRVHVRHVAPTEPRSEMPAQRTEEGSEKSSLLPEIPVGAGSGSVAYPEPPGALFDNEYANLAGLTSQTDTALTGEAGEEATLAQAMACLKIEQATDILSLLLRPDEEINPDTIQLSGSVRMDTTIHNTHGALRHYGFKRAFR